jgi:hypothetical protein
VELGNSLQKDRQIRRKSNNGWDSGISMGGLFRITKEFYLQRTSGSTVLKITVLFTSSATQTMRHFDQDKPAMIETDASDFAIGAVLSKHSRTEKYIQYPFYLENYRTPNSITMYTITRCSQ